MVSKSVGVGVVRHASTHLIGCELNAPVGDSDGQFEGVRFFQVKGNHAVFVEPQTLKKKEAEVTPRNFFILYFSSKNALKFVLRIL